MIYGKNRRMVRFVSERNGRSVVLAFSHGLLAGPLAGIIGRERRVELLRDAVDVGVTGLILSPGEIKESQDVINRAAGPGIFMTVGWTNLWRSENATAIAHDYAKGAYRNLFDVETAVAMGADACHIYLLMGDSDAEAEANEVERIARYVESCHKFGMPVLVEGLIRGDRVKGKERDPGHVAMVARMSMEMGADMLKLEYPGSPESLAEIVSDMDIPILVLGGSRKPFNEIAAEAKGVVKAGAQGVVYGRNIFQAEDPRKALKEITDIVLGG